MPVAILFSVSIHELQPGDAELDLHLIELGESGVGEPHPVDNTVGVDVEESGANTIEGFDCLREGDFLEEVELGEGELEEAEEEELANHFEF